MSGLGECAFGAEKPEDNPGTKAAAIVARGVIVLDTYRVISNAIEDAIPVGIDRAYKHLGDGMHPARDYLWECVHNEVMNSLSDFIDWDRS